MSKDPCEALEESINKLTKSCSSIRLQKNRREHVSIGALSARAIELSVCIATLLKAGNHSGVPILLRSLLEVYCHLRGINRNKNNYNYLSVENLKQQKRILRNIENNHNNNFLLKKSDIPDFESKKKEVQKELSRLKEKGFSEGSGMRGLFERAGLKELNESVYPYLCNHSHSNLSMLRKQHMKASDDGDDFYIFFGKPFPLTEISELTNTCIDVLKDIESILTSEDPTNRESSSIN